MEKRKKFKVGIVIIELIFTLLYFSIQFGSMNISKNSITIGNENITPNLSAGKSVSFEWNCTWGGASWDEGYGVAVDSSGNAYLIGVTDSFGAGGGDIALVKYDGSGIQQWNRTWGGANYDYGGGLAVDSIGNIYIAGYTHSFGAGESDMVLVKYDRNSVLQWSCTWGGDDNDAGHGVTVDSSDNVYLAGSTWSFGAGDFDIVLVKYNGNGTQQWNRTWGGEYKDYGRGVVVDLSGNIYIAGYTASYGTGDYDMLLVKYDGNGAQQWNRTWGGINMEFSIGVAVDLSGNIYIAGYTASFGAGESDMVLIKYNENGMQQWNRTWGGADYDSGYGVAVDLSGNVYLVGSTESFGAGYADMVLLKYDGNGTQQGSRTWGGVNGDVGHGVAVDLSGNIYIAGYTASFGAGYNDMVLVKYGISEQSPSDDLIIILIIVVSIAGVLGIGVVIIYFVTKKRKIVE